MQKIEHIGIAVRSLSVSIPVFEKLLDSKCYKTEQVESEKVDTAFFQMGETKIELLIDIIFKHLQSSMFHMINDRFWW